MSDPDLAAEVRAVCPAFESSGPSRTTRKSRLLVGTVGADRVFVKKLVRGEGIWRWYFEREVAIYRAFAATPPPVRTPRLVAVDLAKGILILEHLEGAPLATGRRARHTIPGPTVAALLAARERIAAWERGLELTPKSLPPPHVLRAIRSRLLEDPSAPRSWIIEGLARSGRAGLVSERAATRAAEILAGDRCVFSHGDLLLRNAICDGMDRVALVDWECAGPHLAAWDRALLRIGLSPADRPDIRGDERCLAASLFALARELKFRRAFASRDGDPATANLVAEIATVERALLEG